MAWIAFPLASTVAVVGVAEVLWAIERIGQKLEHGKDDVLLSVLLLYVQLPYQIIICVGNLWFL